MRRFAFLLAMSLAALVVGAFAAGEARAGDCDPTTATPNTFELGVENNCWTGFTSLFHQGFSPLTSGMLWLQTNSGTALNARGDVAVDGRTSTQYGLSGLLGGSHTIEELEAGPGSAAIYGVSASINDNGPGVWGHHQHGLGSAPGVLGDSSSSAGGATGVKGVMNSSTTGSYSAGVEGANNGTNFGGFGVYGHHAGEGIGVYGESPVGFALSGYSKFNWAAYLQGSVNVVGTLYKSSGAFRIDNPIDPAHSYLQHSFVESPDMKNVYDGVVTTNGKGFATVKLPNWFQALNKDFRYQLTLLGKDAWGAQAIVWEKIRDNRFVIRSKPHVQVSWQVTGIRKDAWANAHRIQVVVPKEGSAAGKYVHPELYGKPMSKSVVVLPGMTQGSKPKFKLPSVPTQK